MNPIPFDLPATCQIARHGRNDPTGSGHLDGMAITLGSGDAGSPVTTLLGELCDQAALAGVLNILRELQLTDIEVKRLKLV